MSVNLNTEEAIEYLESLVAENATEPKEFRVYANAYTDDGIEPREYDLTHYQLNRLFLDNTFYLDTFTVGRIDPDLED